MTDEKIVGDIDEIKVNNTEKGQEDKKQDTNKMGTRSSLNNELNRRAANGEITGKEKDFTNIDQLKATEAEKIKSDGGNITNGGYTAADRESLKYNLADTRIHWYLVLIVVIMTVFFSMVNNVSISEALRRGLYTGAVSWIIAEIIEFIFSIIR